MTTQVNPDILYQKSREDLLLYEDARFYSLLNGVPNFYLVRNDQSLWGAFLRAFAQEIAKLEYAYAYDLMAKQSQYLTPADIKRRWADSLFISSQYPSPTQSDLDYRTMLVKLLAAYRLGATTTAIADVIYAYTGIQIVVEELYKQIGNGIFDQSDRNAIRVSVNVGGSDPLTDIQTLDQLQLIVNSLYGAIDLAKPAHVGLEFTTVFGTDENIDAYVTDISLSPLYGIADQLSITIRLIEQPPFDPMLYQAPILDPANPTTTIAPYGRQFIGPQTTLTPTQWGNLPLISFKILNTVADGTNATYTYEGSAVTDVAIASNVVTITGQNALSPGSQVLFNGLENATFLNGQIVTVVTASGTQFTANFTHAPYGPTAETTGTAQPLIHEGMQVTVTGCTRAPFNVTVKINDVTPTTFTTPLNQTLVSVAESTAVGLVTPTLQAAYYKSGSNYIVGMANWSAGLSVFDGQIIMDSNGNTQMALNSGVTGGPNEPVWSAVLNGTVVDGGVTWRMVGFGQAYLPSYKWIMLLDNSQPTRNPTGEVGNWDTTHPIGLLAPRLNQAWEISGGDTFQSFEMN